MTMYLSTSTAVVAVVAWYVAIFTFNEWRARRKLAHIPSIGRSGFFQFYIGAYELFTNARSMIQAGYDKYPGAFKIPLFSGWLVVLHGPQMVDDVRKAAEDELSFANAFQEGLLFKYTTGMDNDIFHKPYHVSVVRRSVTWNLGLCFPDMNDEIKASFADLVPATDEWAVVPALDTMKHIVFRTSNRFFVGLPLCRDPNFRAINYQYATSLYKTILIRNVPAILQPIAALLIFSYVPNVVKQTLKIIGPTIEERILKEEQLGPDWQGKPNDLISWLIEQAPPELRNVRAVAVRLLTLNFAALHSTSMAMTHTMYDLAAYPHHVAALRDEVESVTSEEGLNKESLDKMYKLDSFIKETLRLHGPIEVSSRRRVLKDFTLSNGMVIPAGNTLSFAGISMHHDEELFENPEQFDGFRFAKMRETEDEQVKYQTVALGREYMTFGVGKHACPGRFFAATALKAMLAHVLLNYDVKLGPDGVRPPDRWFAFAATPNPTASLLFRKRST